MTKKYYYLKTNEIRGGLSHNHDQASQHWNKMAVHGPTSTS